MIRKLDKRLRQSFEGEAIRYQRPIKIEVHGLVGKPLTFIARDEEGHVVKVESTMPAGEGGEGAADGGEICAINWAGWAARRSSSAG